LTTPDHAMMAVPVLSHLVAGVDNILFNDALVRDGALVFANACELARRGSYRSAPAVDVRRKRPLVCLDETSKQLIVETRAPIVVPGGP
jgi:hypothetical protein